MADIIGTDNDDDLVLSKTPCLQQMLEAHRGVGGNMGAVMDVPREHTQKYGILDVVREDGRPWVSTI